MLRQAVSLGSIGGIPLRFHWSWVAVLVAITVVLGELYGAVLGASGAWMRAVVAVALLTMSVLLHELGHALLARRYGLTVSGITLFALGGVTEIVDGDANPVRDLMIAVVGPLVSLVLALVFGATWWFAHEPGITLVALHLALTNGAMALFNLLPGFPLDGGRMLWAIAFFLTDDQLIAARTSSVVGRVCGWVLLIGGIFFGLGSGDILMGGWVVLAGFFLVRNASLGYRRFVIQNRLNGVVVADAMQPIYRAVAPDLPLDQFVGRYVIGQVDQGFPVLSQPDGDAPQPLLGMVSARELRRFRLEEWSRVRVGEVMTPLHSVRKAQLDMSAGDALRTMLESGDEMLPVLDGGLLVGVVRRRDLMRYLESRSQRR